MYQILSAHIERATTTIYFRNLKDGSKRHLKVNTDHKDVGFAGKVVEAINPHHFIKDILDYQFIPQHFHHLT